MITRPARTVAVTTAATNIRKAPASANDVNAYPVEKSVVSYASGGGAVQFVPASDSVYADGEGVIPAATFFTDESQANSRWMCSSTGTVNVLVTDFMK